MNWFGRGPGEGASDRPGLDRATGRVDFGGRLVGTAGKQASAPGGAMVKRRRLLVISEICLVTLFSLCSRFPSGGRENGGVMTSTKQIKLYWVTTDDHDEDWFIFAASARSARAYHEDYEGYGKGDTSSRLIVSNVTLKEFQNGTPPCRAQFQDLCQIGFKNAGT